MPNEKASVEDLGFDRMTAVHRGAQRGYWLYAVLLVLIGIALIIGALTNNIPWIIGIVTGIVAIAISVVPILDAVERGERIEGLAVLEEEWTELCALGPAAAGEREQFLALLRRLYS